VTSGDDLAIRPLTAADAPACDEIVRSLPYHFGDPDGRRECAEAVRRDAGLVALRDGRVVGFLTVVHHFDATSEITWMAVHADHRDRGSGGPWSGG
jgi:ribosomal protein S18 acetylase RimI-like enzyme